MKKKRYVAAKGPFSNLVAAAEVTVHAAESEGKRPTFSIAAYNGEPFDVGWGRKVVLDLRGIRASRRIPVLLDHRPSQIVGQAHTVNIGASSISVEGVITGEDEFAQKVISHAKNGFVWAASVGVSVERNEHVDAGSQVKVNGKTHSGPLYVVRAGRLGEVSFVGSGADETATASIRAQGEPMTFEQWVKAAGFDPDNLTDAQSKALRAAFDAENKVDVTPAPKPKVEAAATTDVDPVAEQNRLAAENATRIGAISKIKDITPEIQAKAIAENWSVEKAELETLRANRPAPAIHASGGQSDLPEAKVLEAAICMSGGLDSKRLEKSFKVEVLEAADKHRSLGLQEMLLIAAEAGGLRARRIHDGNLGDILRAAFPRRQLQANAGPTVPPLSSIFTNVMNKFLLEGYSHVESTWRRITAVRNVSDFKTVTSYRLTGGMQYQKVAPSGQLKHAALGEQSFTNAADTYGIIHGISRKDIINDDLGALTAVPKMIGRGAALKINDIFWTVFCANGSFFTTGNANYFSGSTTNLSIDSLTTGETKFLDQTDPDGKPMAISPKTLLVPNALSTLADVLMASRELRDTTASTKYATNNPHAGKWVVERSSYLGNASYGNSTTAWYLLCDPNDIPVIETCFLHGKEQPTVESADADFDTLGILMRGYHDFGVALQDPRGGVKSKGAA